MTEKMYLGIRVDPAAPTKVLLDGINMESDVKTLKQTATQFTKLPAEELGR